MEVQKVYFDKLYKKLREELIKRDIFHERNHNADRIQVVYISVPFYEWLKTNIKTYEGSALAFDFIYRSHNPEVNHAIFRIVDEEGLVTCRFDLKTHHFKTDEIIFKILSYVAFNRKKHHTSEINRYSSRKVK